MSTNEIRTNDASANANVAGTKMKLEVVVIPVSDVDPDWAHWYAEYMLSEQSGAELPR